PDSIIPDEGADSGEIDADENADVDNAVECDPGYHMEAEGDDENGDGIRGCVKNVTCITEPCNGGTCTELEFTVTCKCITGYAGRWCTDCDTGYLKSTVDDKCKADCTTGSYGCTGSKECVVDPVKNEAGCVCAEFFSGTECTTCDAAHFCNNHGTCAASGANAVCTCYDSWAGDASCSKCAAGYISYEGNCVEGCAYYCEATAGSFIGSSMVTATSYGTCQIVSGTATCVCDAGWENPTLYGNIGGFIIPVCSQCDTDNPPVGGCPE
ncbi:MAG TPA: hypothetical protein PKG52_12935, partial [bacterium]|nr:hypothetical protein [bacterium]